MTWFKATIWTRAALLAVPVLAVQIPITQLQRDLGLSPFSAAHAQEDAKKPERETRRTPALRNKVYEKLSEAQVARRPRISHGEAHSRRDDCRRWQDKH